jgi:hypothetical protein
MNIHQPLIDTILDNNDLSIKEQVYQAIKSYITSINIKSGTIIKKHYLSGPNFIDEVEKLCLNSIDGTALPDIITYNLDLFKNVKYLELGYVITFPSEVLNMKSLETLKMELIDLESISQDQLKQIAGKFKFILSHDSKCNFEECHMFNPSECGLEYYKECSFNQHIMIGIKYIKGVTLFDNQAERDNEVKGQPKRSKRNRVKGPKQSRVKGPKRNRNKEKKRRLKRSQDKKSEVYLSEKLELVGFEECINNDNINNDNVYK